MKAVMRAWKPPLYVLAGLASATLLSHPSGVFGGILLAAAGVAYWAALSNVDTRSQKALKRSSAVSDTTSATARSYYNDQSA